MFLLNLLLLMQEPTINPSPDNWFQYGIAGILAFLMILIIKYITQREKYDKESESTLAKQRSEMYRDDNRIRDERWIKTLENLGKVLEKVDKDGDKFINAINSVVMEGSENYNEAIEKFVQLVNKVMDLGNYQTQVLIELKGIITKLPEEFRIMRDETLKRVDQLAIDFEFKTREG
jgi:hypothetical protein